MIGGARDPEAVGEGDEQLVQRSRSTLLELLEVRAEPVMSYVVRHPHGIPQYNIGHAEILRRIDSRLESHANLHLCGNSYHGVAMNACIKEAEALAEELAAHAPVDSTAKLS